MRTIRIKDVAVAAGHVASRARHTRIVVATACVTAIGLVTIPIAVPAAQADAWGTTANLGSCLYAGQVMAGGQYLSAPGFSLSMQTDGQLVAYKDPGQPLWASETGGNPGAFLAVQSGDGNAVVYSSAGRALWSAYAGSPGDRLCVQTDANVVMRSGSGAPLWALMSGPVPRGQTASTNTYPGGQCTYWASQQAARYIGAFLPNYMGDARLWASAAQARGWAVGSTPRMGSIAVFQPGVAGAGAAGHVAWVTEVYPSQNAITVTEMNFRGTGVVDTRRIAPAFGVGGLQYVYMNP